MAIPARIVPKVARFHGPLIRDNGRLTFPRSRQLTDSMCFVDRDLSPYRDVAFH